MKFKETDTALEPGIDVLNAGLGHMEIKFDGKDAVDTARASRIIADMLRRGYALFVQGTDGAMTRVERFDATTCCYIIADGPTVPADTADRTEPADHVKLPRGKRAMSMARTKVTAVGRSAGG